MSYRYFSLLAFLLVFSFCVAVALFEVAYAFFDLRYFRPPVALNIKLHEKSSSFNILVSDELKSRSNKTLSLDNFTVRTGKNWEILGATSCDPETATIFALGSSTTEQKLVTEGKRWVDQLNAKYANKAGNCVRNYGYGGINLLHATDNFYFLSTLESPAAVILMSNATDVGQLFRYQSYVNGTNHKHKARVVYDGGIPMHEYKILPGVSHVLSKLFKKGVYENPDPFMESFDHDHISKFTELYLDQFKEFYNIVQVKNIPFIYVEEPRIPDLSLLESAQAHSINKNYKKQGVDYRLMATLHRNFSNAVRNEIEQSNWGCYIETNKLNSPVFLYDEGHLNALGSEKLADIIGPFVKDIGSCKKN